MKHYFDVVFCNMVLEAQAAVYNAFDDVAFDAIDMAVLVAYKKAKERCHDKFVLEDVDLRAIEKEEGGFAKLTEILKNADISSFVVHDITPMLMERLDRLEACGWKVKGVQEFQHWDELGEEIYYVKGLELELGSTRR